MERKNIIIYGGRKPHEVMRARFDVVNTLKKFGIEVGYMTTHFETPHADVYFVHDGSVEFVTTGRRFDAAFNFPEDVYRKWVINMMRDHTSETNPVKYLVDLELGVGRYQEEGKEVTSN